MAGRSNGRRQTQLPTPWSAKRGSGGGDIGVISATTGSGLGTNTIMANSMAQHDEVGGDRDLSSAHEYEPAGQQELPHNYIRSTASNGVLQTQSTILEGGGHQESFLHSAHGMSRRQPDEINSARVNHAASD